MEFMDRSENYINGLLDTFRADMDNNLRTREKEIEAVMARLNYADNDAAGTARVLGVDFKAKSNAAKHHCEKYELVNLKEGTPVLRRGGTFSMDLTLNREVELKNGVAMRLFFNFGPAPNVHKGTQAILNVSGKVMLDKSYENWDVRVEANQGKLLTLEVQIPTSAPVGVWTMALELKPKDTNDPGSSRQILRLDKIIYILFNPWNKNDTTYMPDAEQREEYVLSDVGKIWANNRGRHWVFGQFDDAVLPACVLMMERSGLKHDARGDPVLVSRAISKMVNSRDDDGVLVGSWEGEYPDGTPPTQWTGSIKILEEYLRRGQSVKYGQCWVFAGVTNTVCRALGLPARVVTNMESAHDTDVSLTVDYYYDADMKRITEDSEYSTTPGGLGDSIWNYHVWNDVWMERPDLPPGYGGWQAIDATPQETSDGVYQCGPASHEAIRRGKTEFKYDVPFVLAEVNADWVKWQEDPAAPGGYRKLDSDRTHVGKRLLTKKVGLMDDRGFTRKDFEDCTKVYKPADGSAAERVVLHTAARQSRAARQVFRLPSVAEEDVAFSIVDIDTIMIGEDFSVTVKAESKSDKKRTILIALRAGSTYYTGAPAKLIRDVSSQFVLKPGESRTVPLPVKYTQYCDKLVEHAMVKMVAQCKVEETGYAWVGEDCFEVTKPDVLVETLDKAVVGKPFKASFSFTNPLPMALKKCVLVVDGPGLMRPKTIPLKDVAQKGKMQWEQTILPQNAGQFTLVATFNSTQLLNLTGSVKVVVSDM